MIILLLYACGLIISTILIVIYWTLIHPQKHIYDALRSQGVPGEPFVPLIGQLRSLKTARDNDALMPFHMDLVRKHGHVYIIGFGPSIRVSVMEPEMIADILARSSSQDFCAHVRQWH